MAQSLAWRILPGALVLGGVGFILLGPSGCVPFRVCAQGNEIAQAPGPGVRFVGDLPLDAAGRLNEVYTTTFAAKDPWELRWRTTADLVRIDIFTAEAVQTGRYFPSAGHRFVSDTLANSSTIVNESGNFCVRIELRDTAFEAANRAYYSGPARPTGPPPTPRRMAWEVTVESR